MRKWTYAWLAAAVLLVVPQATHAQNADLSGSWTVNFTAVLPRGGGPVTPDCTFQGTAGVNQNGGQISGALDASLTSGGMSCPPVMSATLSGNVTGNQVTMGAMMGNGMLGQATFTGSTTAAPTGVTGTYAATSGPFSGTTGNWSATKAAVTTVPALSASGLALLTLMLLGAATWLLLKRAAPRGP